MVQFSRPDNDDSIGNWADEAGGTTDIFTGIDEVVAEDTELVDSPNNPTAGEFYVAGMSAITDPVSDSGHNLRWRYKKNASGGKVIQITLELRDGTTVIVARVFTNISDVIAQDNYTLSAAEADNIGDYSNLNIRIEAIRSGPGAGRSGHVTWAELEVPDAAAGIIKISDEVLEHVDSGLTILGFNKIGSDILDHAESTIKVLALVRIGDEILDHVETAISKVELRRIADEILEHVESPISKVELRRISNEILDHIESGLSVLGMSKIANEILDHIETAISKITAAVVTAGVTLIQKIRSMDKG